MAELLTIDQTHLLADISLTDPTAITNNTKSVITNFHDTFATLYSNAITFNDEYEKYIATLSLDSSYLKNRLKDAINRAVPDDSI